MRHTSPLLLLLSLTASAHAQKLNLFTNLTYRATWGDLGTLKPSPLEGSDSLKLESGDGALLANCLANPEKWKRAQTSSTIECRERRSPGMRVVFYKTTDGNRQASIHFDLHGPGDVLGHAGEIVRNRLTFGRTSQTEVYRSLLKSHGETNIPAPEYDLRSQTRRYLISAFGPEALGSALGTGALSATMILSPIWGEGFERYSNRIEAALVRNAMQKSIEFGAGALLRQDDTFRSSHQTGYARRARAALYHSFFVPGRSGDEFAFPRVAAAVGTAWVTHEWHPWRSGRTDMGLEVGSILSHYVARSFWHEFKPDLLREAEKGRKLFEHRGQARDTP